MPRKEKTEKSFNDKKGIGKKDAVLKSLFKNIREIEKFEPEETGKELEERDEESELEEDVNDSNINLQNLEFHQFMELQEGQEGGAPVLERIAGSQPRPIFVGGIPRETGTASSNANSRDDFKYVPGTVENGETKYFAEAGIQNASERLDFTRVGRTDSFREEISQERFFRQSEPRIESQTIERFERPERFDSERAGRRNPFERPEAKYEKYRPKLPKS